MAGAVQAFKLVAIDKLRLDDQAEAARRTAESERATREVEKAEEARQDHIAIEALGAGLWGGLRAAISSGSSIRPSPPKRRDCVTTSMRLWIN